MTCVRFFKDGFSVKGHSTVNCKDLEGKLVCSSISSATYLVVNTITDVIGDKAQIKEADGELFLKVENVSEKTRVILDGFKLHMQGLEEQYRDRIKVYVEV